jgi:hypothetical protein
LQAAQHPLSAPPAFVVRPRVCRCYNLVCAGLEIFSCSSRRTGGFRPITTSALRGASVSFAINKSARADTRVGAVELIDQSRQVRRAARSDETPLHRYRARGHCCAMVPAGAVPNERDTAALRIVDVGFDVQLEDVNRTSSRRTSSTDERLRISAANGGSKT